MRSEMATVPPARAFWIVEPGRGAIHEERLAPPGPGEVLVRAEFSGISRGTESLVFGGHVPPSEYDRMRAPFQSGDFPAPVKYGYCSVGVVEDGDAGWRDARIFALYPHQTRYVIPSTAANRIPDAVPSGRAVLAANMETAVNGCWDADPQKSDRVTVIGAGTVGCLVAWVVQATIGCDVELVDINPDRAAIAERLGVRFVGTALTPHGTSGADTPRPTIERTILIHTSGSEAGLRMALDLAAPDGTIVEMSWFGDRQVALPLGGAFHSRRLTIKSSQVGSLPPARRAEWDYRRRLALALDLLTDPVHDVLISGESPFDDLPAVMPRLLAAPGGTLCHRIRYD
jgi:threonine dehydrogenase-like Zn-dependent dehydrogenase